MTSGTHCTHRGRRLPVFAGPSRLNTRSWISGASASGRYASPTGRPSATRSASVSITVSCCAASTTFSTTHATSATPQVPAVHQACCPYSLANVRLPTSCRTPHTQSPTRSSHTHSPAPCTGLTRRRCASCVSAYTWGEWAQQRALTRMQGKPTHARRVGWQTCIWDSMCGR